jgi:hypothetical protein
MINNTMFFAVKLRSYTAAFGLGCHAMLIGPRQGVGRLAAPAFAMAQGSSVPISRGEPPDLEI